MKIKNRKWLIQLWTIFSCSFLVYILIVLFAFLFVDDSKLSTRLFFVFVPMFLVILVAISLSFILVYSKYKRLEINKSFDKYIEELTVNSGVGVLMYDDFGEIYWTSKFINKRFSEKLIGRKINSISNEFNNELVSGKKIFRFTLDDSTFESKVYIDSKVIVIKDVTNEDVLLKQYNSEKLVLGEMEIDNFQQLQVALSEEDLFKVQVHIMKILDELVEKYKITYRQYVIGKYILIASQETLNDLIKNNFEILEKIRMGNNFNGINITVSLGIGFGASFQKELIDLAKEGLLQSQARGGDQVTIIEPNKKPRYFGSKVDSFKISSKVRIKQMAELLELKLQDKSITNVIIYGHIFADLDAIGSALGIRDFVKTFGKSAYIQNIIYDDTTKRAIDKFKIDEDVFINVQKAEKIKNYDKTIVIMVDNSSLERIENKNALIDVNLENIFIFDHHRINKLPKNIPVQNVYIDTSASSTSEIVTELIQFSETRINLSKISTQFLLNGIYLDTKQFTQTISSRTFSAASFLEENGASPTIAVNFLKLPSEFSDLMREVLKNVREIKPGYFLASYDGEIPSDIISLIADEILRVQDRKAAFVVAKIPNEKKYKLSIRGVETNVQVIAEAVGGGGHFSAAAATSDEPLDVFVDNIIQAIVSNNTMTQNLKLKSNFTQNLKAFRKINKKNIGEQW